VGLKPTSNLLLPTCPCPSGSSRGRQVAQGKTGKDPTVKGSNAHSCTPGIPPTPRTLASAPQARLEKNKRRASDGKSDTPEGGHAERLPTAPCPREKGRPAKGDEHRDRTQKRPECDSGKLFLPASQDLYGGAAAREKTGKKKRSNAKGRSRKEGEGGQKKLASPSFQKPLRPGRTFHACLGKKRPGKKS